MGKLIGDVAITSLAICIKRAVANAQPSIPADAVDLGLPSGKLWCSHNVGASNPSDYGLYFSWGNTDGHAMNSGYDFHSTYANTSGAAITAATLPLSADAARANQGAPWRMPTLDEWKELVNNTNWSDSNGSFTFVSKTDSSKYIVLPMAGYVISTPDGQGTEGDYWLATKGSGTQYAYEGYFAEQDDAYLDEMYLRKSGYTVRAIMDRP